MDKFLLCASLVVLSIGTYVIWPSRWNVPAHLNLGFSIVAYLIPIYFVNVLNRFQPSLVHYCCLLMVVGACTYTVGLWVGHLGNPLARLPLPVSFRTLSKPAFQNFALKRTFVLALAGLGGMAISFAAMGFIPALAKKPYIAKYFRGIYAAPYQRVEILYRGSYYIVIAVIPLLLVAWIVSRRTSWAVLTAISVLAIALTLTRGPLATGLLLILGLVAARKRSWTILFIVVVVFAFPLGAIANKLLGLVHSYRQDLLQSIANGSPDVSDCMVFMFHFLGRPQFTHGRTFLGGLVPGHYPWNPSVYSLMVINGRANINDLISGGLRLPAPIWGYTAFGWAGAAAVPFFSGLIQARCIKFVRREGEGQELVRAALVYLFYAMVEVPFSAFYLLSIYTIPALVVYGSYLYVGIPPAHIPQSSGLRPAGGRAALQGSFNPPAL